MTLPARLLLFAPLDPWCTEAPLAAITLPQSHGGFAISPRRKDSTRAARLPTASELSALTKRLQQKLYPAKSEEDLRVGMEFVIRDALPDLPAASYEKSVRTATFQGRADAVHQALIIEYEKPGSMRRTPKVDEAVQQVCDYLTSLRLGDHASADAVRLADAGPDSVTLTPEDEEKLAGGVGVATDGNRFVFVQRRAGRWHREDRRLDDDTVEKLMIWLRATDRKDLSPENLIADFGPQTDTARTLVRRFALLVQSGEHPKAGVIFEEWRRIFGIVYGTEQLQRARRDPDTQTLADAYHLELGVEFPVLLFAVHTYYAMLMKLLATELIVSQGGIAASFLSGLERRNLRAQLRELESGDILHRQNIRNAIEQDFFGWYPEAWSSELGEELWAFVERLRTYDVGTFVLRPDRARDLLKDLYHGLIPESVRHALGEYYTPDWLAEHTLDIAGYDGDPTKSLLDPSCGSGTFLVFALQRVRRWLADHSIEWTDARKKQEAVELIRRNIVGFDLNPLAVIASRTNYLFALGPLLRFRAPGAEFEIPIFLTDSVLLPGRTEGQTNLFGEDSVPFPMAVGTFHLPAVIVNARRVPDLMNLLHESITEGHSRTAFVSSVNGLLGLPPGGTQDPPLERLFDVMKELDKQGKDGVWAKLIRNRYASLLYHQYFDFVVGNPPHVNWEALTDEWRQAAEDEYRRYGLFSLSGLDSRHGGGKKDIAALFTYAVADHFLKHGGVLTLIVHVSLFKTSGAGEGYRRFQLGDGEHLGITEAHDFQSFQPFQTHSDVHIKTRTLSFRAVKGTRTSYPVRYVVWKKTSRGHIPGGLTWREASVSLETEDQLATPLRGTSKEGWATPWLTVPGTQMARCRRVIAPIGYVPHYRGRAGVNSGGLNSAYFVDVLEWNPNGTALIRNLHDSGKIKVPSVTATIESRLLHPVLRGRDVARWHHAYVHHILMMQDVKTQKGYAEDWTQRECPLAWSYFKRFEKLLRARKAFQKFFDPERDPFYSMYNVTADTFVPFKVCWMDVSATMKATVLEAREGEALTIPEHKVMFIAVVSADEAHYLAAVLNSNIVASTISGYAVDNSISTHPIENIVIPRFDGDNALHDRLSQLSRAAHDEVTKADERAVRATQKAIDKEVLSLW